MVWLVKQKLKAVLTAAPVAVVIPLVTINLYMQAFLQAN